MFVLDSSSNITLKGGACSNVHPPPLSADIKSETEQKQIREEELGGQSTGEYGSETPSRVKLKRQPIKDKKGYVQTFNKCVCYIYIQHGNCLKRNTN